MFLIWFTTILIAIVVFCIGGRGYGCGLWVGAGVGLGPGWGNGWLQPPAIIYPTINEENRLRGQVEVVTIERSEIQKTLLSCLENH